MTDNERKEIISALRQLLAMCDFVDQYGDSIDADPYFDAVETAIESLNKTGWIPVSERLPSDSGNYLITIADLRLGHIGEHTVTIADFYAKGKKWNSVVDVVAWMPLPDPWKDGEEK